MGERYRREREGGRERGGGGGGGDSGKRIINVRVQCSECTCACT